MKRKSLVGMWSLASVCAFLTGCGPAPHSADIIGSWREKVERTNGSVGTQTWQLAPDGHMIVTGTATTKTSTATWGYEGRWKLEGVFLYTAQATSTWIGVQEMDDGTSRNLSPDFAMDKEHIGAGLKLTLLDRNRLKVRYPSRREYTWVRLVENLPQPTNPPYSSPAGSKR
ncbi:MAG: hypothetical protein PHR77_20415 [Kiritimatiellae bacterium]|nr:hypothetical protein [Kiritimatiellia bacterium]MDD5521197.1 hypothetical protein [Kiritimatiellia bacterium]